ncbi:YCF48-related protein [Roseateles toxinivorans]|uniref:Photosystem II stability/assembly factor-like uncharacterized protein n=1 Tax=Roseateles toxinivorans TaxID=270368 RepID=A0A4R6QRK8_9BURK|nr:YCF48-related protein [Roseateles toxinivorans]TDP72401.1 photosystem II stability/assembly factor-like uncharacterized protein [Roseateles toxinivorans]
MNRVAAAHAAIIFSGLLLSACGGGGGEEGPPPPPPPPPVTALPDIVSVSAPSHLDVTSPSQFKPSIAAPGGGLKFAWTFGDGGTSSEVAPSYSYPKGGDFEVTLKVTNEAGSTREAKYKVTVNNAAHVKGLQCSGASESGWCWEHPKPTGSDRRDVSFLDAKTGWMVGVNGEIFKTVDGGVSWTRQNSGINATLTFVKFLDAQTGWALGEFGALLRTKDGGATWQLSKLPFEPNYYAATLQVISADKLLLLEQYGGYASSDGGTTWRRFDMQVNATTPEGVIWSYQNNALYKSTDFGATKTKVLQTEAPSAYDSSELKVVGESTVFISRWQQAYVSSTNSFVSSFSLHTSHDGGSTWNQMVPKGIAADQGMLRVQQSTAGALLALQGSMLYRSVDGGLNWVALQAPGAATYWDSGGFQALDASTLVYTGNTYNASSYWVTEDAGATWGAIAAPELGGYSRPWFQKFGGGTWLARTDSAHYLSSDKGKTWTLAVGLPYAQRNQSYRTSWFFDNKRALLLTDQGELKETTDGGLSWKVKLNELSTNYGASKFQFINTKIGWLTADGRLYRSSDGGATWNSGPGAANFADYQFVDENLGWARRSNGSSDLMQTTDGGQSWVKVGEWPTSGGTLRFRDASRGLVAGFSGQIYQTLDGGKTWMSRYSGISDQIMQIQYVDEKLIWAISSSAVLQSTDGGESWKVQRPTTQYAGWRGIAFADAAHGWVVGGAGSVIATQDGGKTWIQQNTGTTRNLSGVQFIDAKAGWITGEQGTILTTGTGGN